MAYTTKNELTHGLGYGVVFTDPTGTTVGIPIAGLRGIETENNQENTNFYAGFNAPYRTIAGAKNTQITVKSYDLPDSFATHALGFGNVSGFLTDDVANYKAYGFEQGIKRHSTQVYRLLHQVTRRKRTKKAQLVKNTNTQQL